MGLAIQYYNGTNWQQFGLTTEDITIDGVPANVFNCVKDSQNNIYILCRNTTTGYSFAKLIKISNTGEVVIGGNSLTNYNGFKGDLYQPILVLSRDESKIFFVLPSANYKTALYSVSTSDVSAWVNEIDSLGNYNTFPQLAIYQDRYIWVVYGSAVRIYDYTTKQQLAIVTLSATIYPAICISTNNICYVIQAGSTVKLTKIEFDGVATLTKAELTGYDLNFANTKQLLIDKWGDLIILTNSGTASTLLKYTTTGTLVHNLNLVNPYYNLNTDKDGNYYYSNALGTYKIAANTAQGQEFTSIGTSIRSSGMATYGNNITGYNPAVFG